MNRKLYKHADNVAAQLNAGISASSLSIPLKTGEGAQLPTTYGSTATSLGSSTLLNSTGIGALGIAVGDIIENVTDGSYAVVKAVNTNSLTTSRLKGGSDNTWQNADQWAVNRFVITLVQYDTDGVTVLKREKVLIDSRSGDNLTVNASGRGFDGSSAQTFSANDHVYLFLVSASMDGVGQAIAQLIADVDNLISQGSGEVYAADGGGTDAYAITLVPAPTAYATGQVFNFKANTANTGAASLNVNSLGAITIKKNHDVDLEDNDIESGQIVTVIYDGTYFQMQSQFANIFATQASVSKSEASGTSGEAFSVGDALYCKASDGKLYKAQGTADEKTFSFVGVALEAATGADQTKKYARPGGVATGLSGLTAGSYYFITDTAGTIGTTPGTRYAKIGQALSTTTLRVCEPKFVASGLVTLSATGDTVVTTGFYPAKVVIRAARSAQAQGSVGDDSNACTRWGAGSAVPSTAYVSNKAFSVATDAATKAEGTINAKSQTGFTINCSTYVDTTYLMWTAYSE